MNTTYPPTVAAAQARIAAVRPTAYARTRNALDGAVSGLSPYITHGFVSLTDVLAGVAARHRLEVQHKLVYELGWRAYFRHVWQHRGAGILQSLHPGPLPDAAYATELPPDVRQGCTGVPVVDQAVHTLYSTGWLHNHARMWLASYLVHIRKLHWRSGADWMYGHLLDGDLASNHLSWQWVAGTGSSKPYLFNADNVSRYAPAPWHSPGTVVDTDYDTLDRLARTPAPPQRWQAAARPAGLSPTPLTEPPLQATPPPTLGFKPPDAALVAGRDLWLLHPWNLGEPPVTLPADTLVVAVLTTDFHQAWPWSPLRWQFVGQRMTQRAPLHWLGSAAQLGAALAGARSVRTVADPHGAPWLPQWAECGAAPALFPAVPSRCDSFSQWWRRATRGLATAQDLLAANEVPAW